MTDLQREEKRQDKMEAISNLADKFLDEAAAKGEPFSEGLCNWAINKAEQTIGGY
jgi:hypothetical protein